MTAYVSKLQQVVHIMPLNYPVAALGITAVGTTLASIPLSASKDSDMAGASVALIAVGALVFVVRSLLKSQDAMRKENTRATDRYIAHMELLMKQNGKLTDAVAAMSERPCVVKKTGE